MRFKEYKKCDVDWLCEIPKHWQLLRVKDIGKVVLGKMLNNVDQDGYEFRYYLKSKNINWLNVNTDSVEEMYFSKHEKKQYRIKKDDLLLSEGGEVGKTCIWNNEVDECYIQNSVHKITIFKTNNPRYYLYLSFSLGASKYYDSIVNQVSIKHLTWEKLIKVLWLVPPLEEQTFIAHYLDAKTQTIDKKISLLAQKADYYKELRKRIINDAVSGKWLIVDGELVEPDNTKESGIEWIGKIPEHWEVKRLKAFAKTVKGRNYILQDKPFENSFPNLSLDYLRNDNTEFVSYCYTKDKSQLVNENDFIIVWDGAGAGEILKGKRGIISSTTAKFVFERTMFSRFFYHLRDIIEYTIKQIPTGMGIPHLNPQILNNFLCPVPPLDEQIEIANYLDEKTQKIDAIISNIGKQIEVLRELRKTLINDVVIGKIKVTA